jgi:hypothetical protein
MLLLLELCHTSPVFSEEKNLVLKKEGPSQTHCNANAQTNPKAALNKYETQTFVDGKRCHFLRDL